MLKKNHLIALFGASVMLICGFACAQEGSSKKNEPAVKAPEPEITQEDIKKVSEAFGNFIGRNLKAPGMNFDLESLVKGIRNGYAGQPSPMNEKEYEVMMTRIQEKAYKQLSADNLKAANDFLAQNSKKDKVVEIVPGKLQYKIMHEGQGATVTEHDSPQIHYTGKYLDGSTFGSSKEAGGPITIPLDQTIPGFSKGILGMKEGEKRELYVHPDMGYGTTGQLPPNSLLIFEVELVKANAPAAAADADDLSATDDEPMDEDEADENKN